MYKKTGLRHLSLPAFEGVESLYNKVKQCSSPKPEHFAKPFPVVLFEFSTFQRQKSVCEMLFIIIF